MFNLFGFTLIALGLFALSKSLLQQVVNLRNEYLISKVEFKRFKSKVSTSISEEQNHSTNFPSWQGYRNFIVAKKIIENSNCVSLYLSPEDGMSIIRPRAGQYLAIKLKTFETEEPIRRKYSISSVEDANYYRITIKKLGRLSQYLFESISVGEKIQCKIPSGEFLLDDSNTPIVFISGGIGITPIIALLEQISLTQPERKTFLFWGVSALADVILSEDFERISARMKDLNLHLFISQTNKQPPEDYNKVEDPWIEFNSHRHILSEQENLLGNTENCALVTNTETRTHVNIFQRKGQWFIKDLGSIAKIQLNKRQISGIKSAWRSFPIKDGDKIEIAGLVLTFINKSEATQKKETNSEKRDRLNIKNFTLHKGRMSKMRVKDFIEVKEFTCYLSGPAGIIEEFSGFNNNTKIECFNDKSEQVFNRLNKLSTLH